MPPKRSSGRAAARNAAAALKVTPQAYEEEEEEEEERLEDPPTREQPTSDAEILEAEAEAEEEEAEVAGRDAMEPDEAAQETDDAASGAASPGRGTTPRGRRKPGRPARTKPVGWSDADDKGSTSEQGTPARRGRGRGGFRGIGRWAKRHGPSVATTQVVDDQVFDIVNDEVDLPEDPEGELKVDKLGHLQGEREYRCRTFTVIGREKRLYMLSTEPARCVGFRDSYLFFAKHKRLFKIIVDDEEKRDLIERDIIPHSYKGRTIGICTARSVFREFGAKIIVGGKRITDDYEVAAARAEGAVEGDLADPEDAFKQGESYNKNQYVAWHGASAVYHSGQPVQPPPGVKVSEGKKKKVMINDGNWMLEHARAAADFNAAIGAQRRKNLDGIYDPHTNVMQYPRIMQPTHARWEVVKDSLESAAATLAITDDPSGDSPSLFHPVKPASTRRYRIVDVVYEAPSGPWGIPGPDGGAMDLGFNGLSGVADDILEDLPPDCRQAFEEARAQEAQWKSRWSCEARAGSRIAPPIDRGQF